MNSSLLNEVIEESGYRKVYLAKRMGLSYQGFVNKCKGDTEFTVMEMNKLISIIPMDEKTSKAIFFDKESE